MNEHAAGGEIRGPIHDPDSVPFFLSPTSSECAGGPMHESVVVLGEEIPDGLSFDEKCARVAKLMTEFSTKPRA